MDEPSPAAGSRVGPEPQNWQRVHPLTLLVEFVNSLKQLAIPLFFIFSQRDGSLGGLIDIGIVVGPLALAGARYWSTRYAIDDNAIHFRHGVFKRIRQDMPRANVQNVSSRSQLLARLTNLTELQISDASAEGDINLRLLSQAEADHLSTVLRQTATRPAAPTSPMGIGMVEVGAPPAPPTRDPKITTATPDLIRASLGNGLAMGPLIFMVTLAAIALGVVLAMDGQSVGNSAGLLLGVVGPLFLLAVPARVITPILRLYGFRLWSDPDRIRTESGLFTQQRTAARRERVQVVHVDRLFMMRKLGVERVRFATADLDGPQGGGVTYLSPGADFDSWPKIAAEVLGRIELTESDLHKVSPITKRRTMVRFAFAATALLPGAVVLAMYGLRTAAALWVAALAALLLLGDVYSRRRWSRLGYAVGDSQLLVRNGAIDETLRVLRKDKVQSVRLDESFFQRRLGLASLRIGTAGTGGLSFAFIEDLPLPVAKSLMSHLAWASSATPLSETI